MFQQDIDLKLIAKITQEFHSWSSRSPDFGVYGESKVISQDQWAKKKKNLCKCEGVFNNKNKKRVKILVSPHCICVMLAM